MNKGFSQIFRKNEKKTSKWKNEKIKIKQQQQEQQTLQ